MTRHHRDKDSVMSPAQVPQDITPHATDVLANTTRFIMVSDDGATVTGYMEGDKTNPHTTMPLRAGLIYPFSFIRVTAVSSGTIKGYS